MPAPGMVTSDLAMSVFIALAEVSPRAGTESGGTSADELLRLNVDAPTIEISISSDAVTRGANLFMMSPNGRFGSE
jgi:hypothetical protein